MKIKVIYSTQPDEKPDASAAFAYATRVSHLIQDDDDKVQTTDIQRLSLDSLDLDFTESTLHLFIISCSADGSVDRVVRKIVRSLKNNTPQKPEEEGGNSSQPSHTTTCRSTRIGIALLGHARCENSANQMKDTIFSNGRKFQHNVTRLFGGDRNENDHCWILDGLEVQVELEGPDAPGGFDDWVKKVSS